MSQQTPTNAPDLATGRSTGAVATPSTQADTDQGGTTQHAADVARSGAAAVGTEARDRVVDLRDTAQGEARTVVHDAKDQAAQVLATTRDQLRHQADEQAGALARTLRDIGDQLSKMADGSDDEGSEVVRLVRGAADQATRSADHLDEGGIDTLMGDLTRTARTRPGLFLLGSAAAGFTVGRLVRHLDTGELSSVAREAMQGDTDSDQGSSSDEADGRSSVGAPPAVPAMVTGGGGPVLDTAPPPPPPPPSTAGWTQPGGPTSTGTGS